MNGLMLFRLKIHAHFSLIWHGGPSLIPNGSARPGVVFHFFYYFHSPLPTHKIARKKKKKKKKKKTRKKKTKTAKIFC